MGGLAFFCKVLTAMEFLSNLKNLVQLSSIFFFSMHNTRLSHFWFNPVILVICYNKYFNHTLDHWIMRTLSNLSFKAKQKVQFGLFRQLYKWNLRNSMTWEKKVKEEKGNSQSGAWGSCAINFIVRLTTNHSTLMLYFHYNAKILKWRGITHGFHFPTIREGLEDLQLQ